MFKKRSNFKNKNSVKMAREELCNSRISRFWVGYMGSLGKKVSTTADHRGFVKMRHTDTDEKHQYHLIDTDVPSFYFCTKTQVSTHNGKTLISVAPLIAIIRHLL
ncbi:MAG: hypothetical protein WCL46_11155 [Chlorobium sp.]